MSDGENRTDVDDMVNSSSDNSGNSFMLGLRRRRLPATSKTCKHHLYVKAGDALAEMFSNGPTVLGSSLP